MATISRVLAGIAAVLGALVLVATAIAVRAALLPATAVALLLMWAGAAGSWVSGVEGGMLNRGYWLLMRAVAVLERLAKYAEGRGRR